MIRFSVFITVAVLAASLFTALPEADAKRFGGGRSFGSSSGFSRPSQKPAQNYSTTKPTTPTRPGTAMARPGMRGFGPMGLFGTIFAGSLLGSMFFGTPFAGPGMLDLILIGLLVFLGFRLFSRLRGSPPDRPDREDQSHDQQPTMREAADRYSQAEAAWKRLESPAGKPGPTTPTTQVADGSFDEDEFLHGAKLVYSRMQDAWDRRDLDDIRQFATDEVYTEISRQAAEDPGPSQTEVLLVEAVLTDVHTEGTRRVATVHYNVLIREDATKDHPERVEEIWEFVRDEADDSPLWRLSAIRQIQ